MEYKKIAESILLEAGEILKKNFGKVRKISTKKNWQDLVTSVDVEANKLIVSKLKKHFPDHTIISEELPEKSGDFDYVWFVDPLDGTTNYTLSIPFFSTALALLKKGKPFLGMVYNPVTQEFFCGISGRGSWLNGRRIRVSKNSDIKKTLINYCHVNRPEDVRLISKIYYKMKLLGRDFRRLGSAGLDICWVACGRNDVWFHPSVGNLWDILPGLVIAKEAGAKITDWQGRNWMMGKSKDILITNGKVHKVILEILCKVKK
ncbi:MAG: hypothetical protein DRP12_03450 [Candidatus Aenigmatarchaeota archaeon]|nr:MAG: hypothetical protein DRP12_03450 [Candidatus Aenigmarchaeota archaeon]